MLKAISDLFAFCLCRHRKERQLQDVMIKFKRHSVTGQLPVRVEQTLFDSQVSDTTDDEVDSHIRDHTSPGRYGGPGSSKIERAISFDTSTPRGTGRKRQWRRKRRCSNTKEEAGPTTFDPDMMDSKQALLPSRSPSHSPPSLPQQQTTPTGETSKELVVHSTSGESTPRLPLTHELPITAEGDLSPAVAQFLDSVKHHNVRRSSSNGSLRTHRRMGSNGSTHSYRNPSPLSGSPVKGSSQCNSTTSLSKVMRALPEHISSRRGSGSGVLYTKLNSSSSEEEDKEHETGTLSSDHNTTSDGQSFGSRLKLQTNESRYSSTIQNKDNSSSRDMYSNESSGDTRCSDGGHDADGESDVNSMDLLSELEPNESNLESLHSPSNMESSDINSTTPDILDSESTLNLIPNPKSKTPPPHSPGHKVATLITQFETSSDSSLSNSHSSHQQIEQPEIPLHIRRDSTVPLARSYSPKAVEDFLEGGL